MKKNIFLAAKLVHSQLRIQSNCYTYQDSGKLIPATHLVAIDDDPTSAMWTAWLYHKICQTYGYCPEVLCVGGKGLMSKYTHRKSEAELLAYVLKFLGVNPELITCLGKGRNTGDNVLAVAKAVPENAKVIWCVTQRLSLRLERTQAMQAPQVKSFYYVIEQDIQDVMKLYNGKGLCDGEILLHELASLLNRCDAYAGTFQKPLEFEVDEAVRVPANKLEQDYRLKLPNKNFKSYLQFIRLYFAILKNKKRMRESLKKELYRFSEKLQDEFDVHTEVS